MVKSRIMETMLLYLIDTLSSNFTNVKTMMEDTLDKKKGKWYNAVEEYRIELGVPWDKLKTMDKLTLKKAIRDYDTVKWFEGMSKKQSLRFYIQEKKEIHYDLCYRNSINSTFYAKARVNALKLEEHKGRGIEGYNKKCKLCGEEDEDLVHFISKCKELEQVRDYDLLDRNISDPEERMRILLFRDDRSLRIGKLIRDLWDLRRQQLKEIEKVTRGRRKDPQPLVPTTQGCKGKKGKQKMNKNRQKDKTQ